MIKRRQFVKDVLTTTGLLATSSAFANVWIPKKKEKLGVALVGLGYYSTDLLAPALQVTKHCYLSGIVTGTPEKAESWKKQFSIPDKNIYNYQNFDEIANNDDIDVIYIVLPNSMHAEYVMRAAKAGKHVWCEKPMAVSVQECQQMIDACKNNNVKLSIGYRMQHEPNTQQIMALAKTRPYGMIIKTEAQAGYVDGRANHWKQKKAMGGGATYDMGVYTINAARYSTKIEPVAVKATQSTDRPDIYQEVDETMVFELDFPNKIKAYCKTSFGQNLNDLKVTCEKGWYGLTPFQSYSGIKGMSSDGKRFNARVDNQQAKQMDDDALSIINNTPVLVPGEEGLKDIRVVEAIYRSVREGKKVGI